METKICNICDKELPATSEYFHRKKSGKYGFCAQCKICRNNLKKEYYQENKEEIKKSVKQYQMTNRDKIKEYKEQYYKKNKDEISNKKKTHYYENRERINERNRQYYSENKDKIKEQKTQYRKANLCRITKQKTQYANERRKTDISYRILENCRSRLKNVIRRQGESKSTTSMELIGCTVEQLLEHLENQFTEGMTWDNYGEWHIDHIRPCSSFDITDEQQQRECFHYTNLQPLWAIDNLIKGDSY